MTLISREGLEYFGLSSATSAVEHESVARLTFMAVDVTIMHLATFHVFGAPFTVSIPYFVIGRGLSSLVWALCGNRLCRARSNGVSGSRNLEGRLTIVCLCNKVPSHWWKHGVARVLPG